MQAMGVVVAPGVDISCLEATEQDRFVLVERRWESGSFLALGEALLEAVKLFHVLHLMLAGAHNSDHC